MTTTNAPRSEIITLSELPWQERQPGVRTKTIWEHPETRRRAVMTRIESDAKLPLHRHVGDELVFVIEGAISDEFGTVTAGNMGYRPDGCVHTVSTPNGATVLAFITGGVEARKAIRIPQPARSSGSWHAWIMPDSGIPAATFPPAARAGSLTLSRLFLPTHFHADPFL